MQIVNDTRVATTWFAYDSTDPEKEQALQSGQLSPGGATIYVPADNSTGFYYVRFCGAGKVQHAGGTVQKEGAIALRDRDGAFFTVDPRAF